MKDSIYTIPVSEAFEKDCECPICELKARFEKDSVEYYIGPSLMEPDTRIETNDTGFCSRHFELMYDTKANRLGLGLMLDTYMQEQISRLKKTAGGAKALSAEPTEKKSLFKGKSKGTSKSADIIDYLEKHEKKCSICKKLDYTMDRYIEIILQWYFSDKEFRERFKAGKGFCLPHLKLLLIQSKKQHNEAKHAEFTDTVIRMQLENMERIEQEVDWFTKKFDYRNQDAPWGNSRDALIRGIKKMTGAENIE